MPSAGPALMKPSVKIILIFVPAYATILLFTQALMCVGRKIRRKQISVKDKVSIPFWTISVLKQQLQLHKHNLNTNKSQYKISEMIGKD